ncbi:MAG: hypothetical protein ABI867_41530 [Kofleriaceae bacterium]
MVLGFAVLGCGSSSEPGIVRYDGWQSEPGPPPELAALMPEGVQEAWQGAWFTQAEWPLSVPAQAFEIKGSKVTVFDGLRETTFRLAVANPSQVWFVPTTNTATIPPIPNSIVDFRLEDGNVIVEDRSVGVRRGRTAFVTRGTDTVIANATGCRLWMDTRWPRSGSEWVSKSVVCAWSISGGTQTLSIVFADGTRHFEVAGDVLLGERFEATASMTASKMASYQEAKARVLDFNRSAAEALKAK